MMESAAKWHFEIKIGDIDLYQHVSHVAYFYYIEEATVRFFKMHNIDLAPGAITPVVASASCKFIRSIEYPATITIDGVASMLNPKKLLIKHTIQSEDASIVHAIGEKVMVWYDFVQKSAVDIPPIVLQELGLNISN